VSHTGRLISKLENERIRKWGGLRRFGRKTEIFKRRLKGVLARKGCEKGGGSL